MVPCRPVVRRAWRVWMTWVNATQTSSSRCCLYETLRTQQLPRHPEQCLASGETARGSSLSHHPRKPCRLALLWTHGSLSHILISRLFRCEHCLGSLPFIKISSHPISAVEATICSSDGSVSSDGGLDAGGMIPPSAS